MSYLEIIWPHNQESVSESTGRSTLYKVITHTDTYCGRISYQDMCCVVESDGETCKNS